MLALGAALLLAGCGSSTSSSASKASAPASTSPGAASSSSSAVALPTAVLHAGLALGAFHHYIYAPFKSGAFTHGLFKHKIALAKAALAGLFAYHELRLALADAKASPLLSKLLAPFDALLAELASLAARLKGGHVDAGALSSADAQVEGLTSQARRSGFSIAETVPGASQLAGAL